MVGFFGKLFGRDPSSSETPEQTVRRLLTTLPKCSKFVVGASPKYGNEQYRCEVLISAIDLLPWAQRNAESRFSSDPEDQAANEALPIWLRSANASDVGPTYVPVPFVNVMSSFIADFVEKGIAQIQCPDCSKGYQKISTEKRNVVKGGTTSTWTDEWFCPNGHLLYRADQRIHIYRG